MLKKNIQKAIFCSVALLSVAACTSNSPFGLYKSPDVETYNAESGERSLVTQAEALESGIIKAFPDVPIPSTHKIDLKQSVIFASPSQTVGKITLLGRGNADSVFRFFESQMPNHNWSLVNSFQSSTSSMYWAKPGRFVAIIIEADGNSGSRVFINVGPE